MRQAADPPIPPLISHFLFITYLMYHRRKLNTSDRQNIMIEPTKPHSKLGIASCVIAVIAFLMFLLAMVLWTNDLWCPGCLGEIGSHLVIVGLGAWLLMPFLGLVGVILGAVSLFFPTRRKVFPIIGIVLNLIIAMIGMFPILLGIALAA
jgi:hypothetical protein